MIYLRTITHDDLAGLYALSQQVSIGLTSLPRDEKLLRKKIQLSQASLRHDNQQTEHQLYFFVLCDSEDKQKIIGCCAIEAAVGGNKPFYSYKISTLFNRSDELDISKQIRLLTLVNDYQGATELCSLYLQKEYRKTHISKLLSCSRFLFMAQHPELFSETVIAELRGVSDNQGISPFWKHLGEVFFGISFATADHLTGLGKKQFIADLMPKYPVYVELLAPEAQATIGKAHPSARGAQSILEQQNFRYKNYIDIFDAGPTYEAYFPNITYIKRSKLVTLERCLISNELESYLIANTKLQFRALRAPVQWLSPTAIAIGSEAAELLNVQPGEQLRIIAEDAS